MSEKFDFVQTMKDWRRMCKHYSDESMKDGQHSCVDMCPLGHNTACGDIDTATDRHIEDLAKAIEQWVAEHPEPVYPTWVEWLVEQGILKVANAEGTETMYDTVLPKPSLFDPIPADIAEKLDIEPKEG